MKTTKVIGTASSATLNAAENVGAYAGDAWNQITANGVSLIEEPAPETSVTSYARTIQTAIAGLAIGAALYRSKQTVKDDGFNKV